MASYRDPGNRQYSGFRHKNRTMHTLSRGFYLVKVRNYLNISVSGKRAYIVSYLKK